ncbi:MAG: NCS2 family permease [Lactobacillales bacterium]|jgi:AGZA family xanthine/uracil permease-like MFS transporter|nr:NCS2 family permease [Lactobacillales bacterium]
MLEKLFKLKENNTNVRTEVIAGLTTFFAMSYILFVNPSILSNTGMNPQAVFMATVIGSAIGTLMMAFYANLPLGLAPGMGLNAFFTYTVCLGLGFKWQEALAMVLICGVVAAVLTLTKLRIKIINAIPRVLQHSIGAGIGIFVGYIGLKSLGILQFSETSAGFTTGAAAVPGIAVFNNAPLLIGVAGLIITIILVVKKVPASIFIGIIVTTIIAIPFGLVHFDQITPPAESFKALGHTFGAVFGPNGFASLIADPSRYATVLMAILAFVLTDMFDAIGTFIGTARKMLGATKSQTEDVFADKNLGPRLERGLVADFAASITGAICGTSNVTCYVESAAGVAVGGRTGLTGVVVAGMFLISGFFSPLIGIVPGAATAPALVIVGILMTGSLKLIDFDDFATAAPCFFACFFMSFAYSITYGIATAFILYVIIQIAIGKWRTISPVIYVVTLLFIIDFIFTAVL